MFTSYRGLCFSRSSFNRHFLHWVFMLGILCLLSCRKYLWKLRTITTWEFGGVRRVCANRAFWLVTYRWCRCYCQQCSMEHVRTSAFETTVFFLSLGPIWWELILNTTSYLNEKPELQLVMRSAWAPFFRDVLFNGRW